METPKTSEIAHIGRSVVIKGELSGSEDLYVDGQVEGTIELHSNSLTVGPNGHIRANVNAKNVVVQGHLEGNVKAIERAELTKSAVVSGDITAQKIAIEEGAFFKGKVDIQREPPKTAVQPPVKPEGQTPNNGGQRLPSPPVAGTVASPVATPAAGASTATGSQTPVTEQKKF